ncbi:cyclohexadienyl dehydrogenase [bacterium YEK0313]|nr:cyclohexadienyl dehydrogenase [bacterium YEK0313]
MTNTLSLALIGFGEVGQTFARQWLARGDIAVAAYDILFDDPERAAGHRALAVGIGVTPADSPAAAVAAADIVVSAVTASAVLDVAATLAPLLRAGQVVFDINSAAPATKRQAAALIGAARADYVEGAVMAPVGPYGIRVPILAGGPQAARIAATLNAVGMDVTAVAVEHGRASAMKLCRSIMIKGIEALIVESAAAAKAFDVEAEVFASLAETFPAIDWPALAANMAERIGKHGIRRAAEMREAADMVAEIGIDPALCRAVADAQERGAQSRGAGGGPLAAGSANRP